MPNMAGRFYYEQTRVCDTPESGKMGKEQATVWGVRDAKRAWKKAQEALSKQKSRDRIEKVRRCVDKAEGSRGEFATFWSKALWEGMQRARRCCM